MAAYRLFTYLTIAALTFSVAYATDPTQLQDFCVATNDMNNALFVNGLFCKNPMAVTADDFFKNGLDKPGNTDNMLGSAVTPVAAAQLPGLNTLGISLARLDFAPYGLVAPHTHPRATEVFTVMEGTIYVGFVTSNPADNSANKLFTKVLKKGDVFVFPQGLVHFQLNVGKTPAFSLSALSSQNPGVVTVGNAVFRSEAPISVDVLSKAFQLDANVIKQIQSLR
ncbi:germin-like protein isoform X1 [Chenopodium quinoa]|uniref:germin-like protein isoform X1 n=1 Tax=Chenopodium quinoa TaxID=63459 RepID=UPI000B77A8F7|nr:germin-like protein isoform X1 [Chenopodium quinoa]